MPGTAAVRRRRIVGASTKMYFDYARTIAYARRTAELADAHARFPLCDAAGEQTLDIFVAPDFVCIVPVAEALLHSSSELWVGAQNVSDADAGALTGEVSPATLAQAGCRIVEIGHAERRRCFGEDDACVARKAAAVHRHGMLPLVCVGEETRTDIFHAASACFRQVDRVLAALPAADLVLAYEPVWAIGAAQPADPQYIAGVIAELRARCHAAHPRADGSLRIIYGGAAGPGMYSAIAAHADGLFLGRAAHDPAAFLAAVLEVADA